MEISQVVKNSLKRTPFYIVVKGYREVRGVFRRYKIAMSYNKKQVKLINKWVFSDSEESNFYYNLSERNILHLSHFLSGLTNASPTVVSGYLNEILNDEKLKAHILQEMKSSNYN
jgi:hypothetical protein